MCNYHIIIIQILQIIDQEKVEGVLISGDVYDKAVPSAEAVQLFDDFLVRLASRSLKVFIISGNHDSAERIAFGAKLMDKSGIYMSPVYNGIIEPITLEDAYGPLNFYLLPFIKPAHVRRYFDDVIITYTDALRVAVENMKMDPTQRNILLTHQFVTGALRSDSEEISVGGSDNVDAEVFKEFDYVALGHIHRAQKCVYDHIRYCGTPLKYSFSEAKDQKSVTIIDIKAKGDLEINAIPLTPKRDMEELKGTYEQLTFKEFYENTSYQQDYVHITLTDEEDILDVLSKLRVVYQNLMKLDYDNQRTRHHREISGASDVTLKSPYEHFEDFYTQINGQPLNDEQQSYIQKMMEEIWR
jgi:exonuclease SbcD